MRSCVADRILAEVLKPFTVSGREIFLPANIGIAVSATGYTHADEVLRDSEAALHRGTDARRIAAARSSIPPF